MNHAQILPGWWWCECGSGPMWRSMRRLRQNRGNRDWIRGLFSPSPLLTFTVRITNGSTKVGLVLTPTSQPRVYLVHSIHDVQSVPTRVKKGEDLRGLIVLRTDPLISKQFMDKRLFVHLQGGRKVSGTLRGYDLFLNLVLDDAQEETTPAQRHPIGTVVRVAMSLTPFLLYTERSRRLSGATT